MSILMGRKGFPGNSTVALTHSYTQEYSANYNQADILGVPNYLKAEMVKDGAVVDVGITRVADETAEKDISLQVMLILIT
jgi:methylenetetrahydrofolate dehydrogenase (NADP+)/methenyltetrahydrofolate cyclohydrolase